MRSGLATRVDRIGKRIERTTPAFSAILCKLYDRDDSEIVGLAIGVDRVARLAGETVAQLLERARVETGFPMWAADYSDIDRCGGWSERAVAKNRSDDGPTG